MRPIDMDFVEKENNMNKIAEEATRELCHIIAYESNKSSLRWANARDNSTVGYNSIYICNSNNPDDKVCRVRMYETSLKISPVRAYYYVYFTDKYSSVAKDIKDPRIAGITEADGYKFVCPKHVVDFIREVVRLKERGGVLKDCKTEVVDRMERSTRANMTYGVLTTLMKNFAIKDVIFNDPATIVKWSDGTKTVVKAENEEFDPEKGLAMAICKRMLGNKYDYYDIFKKYVGRYEKKQKKGKK